VTVIRTGGKSVSGTTNDEGFFRIPNLEPGNYTVRVEGEKGFANFEQTNVPVNLTRTSTVTIQLRPQAAGESVTVTAGSGAAIDVTRATTGTNVAVEKVSSTTNGGLYTVSYVTSLGNIHARGRYNLRHGRRRA
jgi:hypothetical protein